MSYEGAPVPADRTEVLRFKIARDMYELAQATGGGGGGGITTQYPAGTLTVRAKVAGENEVIPPGAFNIGIIFNTGTGTINGVAWPTGLPFNIEARLAAAVTVQCGTPGTASINYLS